MRHAFALSLFPSDCSPGRSQQSLELTSSALLETMQTRGATRAFSALLPLLLLATSSLVFAVTAEDSSSSPAASPRHFVVDARDVLVSFRSLSCCPVLRIAKSELSLPTSRFRRFRSASFLSLARFFFACPKKAQNLNLYLSPLLFRKNRPTPRPRSSPGQRTCPGP